MNGTLTRSIGRDLHKRLEITNPHEDLLEGATVNLQPDDAADELVKAGLFKPGRQDPSKVKGEAKSPAIADGK